MADKTLAESQADWIAASHVITIREKLESGTDEFRYRILEALLANELEKFRAEPFL
jgi:hypothetical protein